MIKVKIINVFFMQISCFLHLLQRIPGLLCGSERVQDRHNRTSFLLIRHSSTIQYSLTQFHHHFHPNFTTCNYYLHTYFTWSRSPILIASFALLPQFHCKPLFSTGPCTTSVFTMWSHSFSSFMIFYFQIFALFSSIKLDHPPLPLSAFLLPHHSFFILLRYLVENTVRILIEMIQLLISFHSHGFSNNFSCLIF